MTLRRYSPLKPSRGTVIPTSLRQQVRFLDLVGGYQWAGCAGPRIGMPGDCFGGIELDHVRAGSFGKKSATERGNLVSLCSTHHREKTLNGRKWRPLLLAYIEERDRNA